MAWEGTLGPVTIWEIQMNLLQAAWVNPDHGDHVGSEPDIGRLLFFSEFYQMNKQIFEKLKMPERV